MAKKASESRNARLFKRYLTKMSSLLATTDANEVLTGLTSGTNTYMRIDRLESSAFDQRWIKEIEDVIMDLGDIVANPRQTTKTTSDLVPVELARKTNSESIRHLASHTQFIKDINEKGDVIPNKILTIGNDDDLHTYENRFIATFIRKLVLFIEKRYEFIAKFAPLHDEEILMFKNHSFIDESEVEIETKVKVKTEKQECAGIQIQSYLDRILKIREYVLYFYNSSFMKQLKTDKDVRNPILQTNIIRKNLKYHHCYEVYKFIEKYESLGVTYKVDENYSQFNNQELKEINYALLINFLTLKAKHMSDKRKTNTKTYKPKILTSCDDEEFVYGPLLKGPIEFVRTDDDYQQYLNSKVRKDLPIHPTNKQKEYYKEEYELKKETKEDEIEKEKLLKRKAKELAEFNKRVEEIINEREAEERRINDLIEKELRRRDNEVLDALRISIIDEAKKGVPVSDSKDDILESIKNDSSKVSGNDVKTEKPENSDENEDISAKTINDSPEYTTADDEKESNNRINKFVVIGDDSDEDATKIKIVDDSNEDEDVKEAIVLKDEKVEEENQIVENKPQKILTDFQRMENKSFYNNGQSREMKPINQVPDFRRMENKGAANRKMHSNTNSVTSTAINKPVEKQSNVSRTDFQRMENTKRHQ